MAGEPAESEPVGVTPPAPPAPLAIPVPYGATMGEHGDDIPINAIDLADGVWVHPDDLTYRFSRGSGPGGQSINKLATRAELRLSVGDVRGLTEAAAARLRRLAGQRLTQDDELVFHAQTHRSQLDNRRACLERLRALVAEAISTPKPRKKSRPTRAAIERRLAAKRRAREKKQQRRWRAD